MKSENVLQFAGGRYLWLSLILCAVSLLLYLSHVDLRLANGGTWQGYTLGAIGLLLIVWLSVLGIRKRSYGSRMGTVMGWTSAHIYLGLSLIIVATLHTGFEFAWNLHLLAYLFMLVVIISGIIGTVFYILFPRQSFLNRNSLSSQKLQQQVTELHEKILGLVPLCTKGEQLVIASALENTEPLHNNLLAIKSRDSSFYVGKVDGQLVNVDNPEQATIRRWLAEQLMFVKSDAHLELMTGLLELFSDYGTLLKKVRAEQRTKVLFKLWLAVHIPCTIALIVALTTHILTTFMYW